MDLKQNCTAGRTVLFSAVTVAMSLAGLQVFPLFFLRSLAYAGTAVALTAAVVLPPLPALLGPRVDRLDLRRALRRRRVGSNDHEPSRTGAWHRIATAVMRCPVL